VEAFSDGVFAIAITLSEMAQMKWLTKFEYGYLAGMNGKRIRGFNALGGKTAA
jgi:hypothetical protein